MSTFNGRTGAARSGDGLYLNCPQCGLSIAPRAKWLWVEYCPRCLARSRTLVELFAARLSTRELYRHGLAPDAEGPTVHQGEARSMIDAIESAGRAAR